MSDSESLIELGKSIDEIFFKELPDSGLLNELCDGAHNIRIHFPLKKAAYLNEYSESPCDGKIVSANFETDIFTDSIELYKLPYLETLILTCKRKNIERLDKQDLHDMQLAIENLGELKSVTFNIPNLKTPLVEEFKLAMRFSSSSLKVLFSDKKLKKKK